MSIILRFHVAIPCKACTSMIIKQLDVIKETFNKEKFNVENGEASILPIVEFTTFENEEASISITDDEYSKAIIESFMEKVQSLGFDLSCTGKTVTEDKSLPSVDDIQENDDDDSDSLKLQSALSDRVIDKPDSSSWTIIYSVIKGAVGMIAGFIMMSIMLSGMEIPVSAMHSIVWISSGFTLLLGMESYVDAIRRWFIPEAKKLTMDTLITISTLMQVAGMILSMYFPMHFMGEAGFFILAFRHFGKAIEKHLEKRIDAGLSLEDRGVKKVMKRYHRDKNDWREVASEKLKSGNVIRVYGGQTIPVDGKCKNKKCLIIKTAQTGFSLPVNMKYDDEILSGMEVPENQEYIEMMVTKPVHLSYLAELQKACVIARNKQASIEKTADEILWYFIPAVLAVSALTGFFIGAFVNPYTGLAAAITMLVSACPCTFACITPYACKIGMTRAYEKGVEFRENHGLEKANKIDTVIFDIHGTVTIGQPEVVGHKFFNLNEEEESHLLATIALLEEESSHAVATVIHAYALERTKFKSELKIVREKNNQPHPGLRAKVNEVEYMIGNSRYIKDHQVELPADIDTTEGGFIFVARENHVIGFLKIKYTLRKDAEFAIKDLQKSGFIVHLASGGDEFTVKQIADKLEINHEHILWDAVAYAGMESEGRISKQTYTQNLINQGKRVAAFGDALNDLAMISASHCGFAVKSVSGSRDTQNNADAIIFGDSLLPALSAFSIAESTISTIKKTLLFSLGYNFVTAVTEIGLAAGLKYALHPAAGMGIMILQMIGVLVYLERVRHQKLPYEDSLRNHLEIERQQNTLNYGNLLNNKLGPSRENELDSVIADKGDRYEDEKNDETKWLKSGKKILGKKISFQYASNDNRQQEPSMKNPLEPEYRIHFG